MCFYYLHCWQNGPGPYTRDGNVALAVDAMATRSTHIHSAQGFPFNHLLGCH